MRRFRRGWCVLPILILGLMAPLPVTAGAAEAMEWAVGAGIITGTTAWTLDPQGTATRAQLAVMLQRFLA